MILACSTVGLSGPRLLLSSDGGVFLHVHGTVSEAEEDCRLEGAEAGMLELILMSRVKKVR